MPRQLARAFPPRSLIQTNQNSHSPKNNIEQAREAFRRVIRIRKEAIRVGDGAT